MQQKHISYEKAFNFGFKSFIDNLFTFFMVWICSIALMGAVSILALLVLVVGGIFAVLSGPILGIGVAATFTPLFALFLFLAYFFYQYQLIRFSIALYEGRPLSWTDIFSWDSGQLIQFSCARFIRYIKIALGLILFIVPGIYFMLKYYFAGYSLLDGTSKTVGEDIRLNAHLSQGIFLEIGFFAILLWALSSLVAIIMFFPLPIVYLTSVHAYKQLTA